MVQTPMTTPDPRLMDDAERFARKLAEALVVQRSASQARFDAEWALFHARDAEEAANASVARNRSELLRIIELSVADPR